MEAESMEIFVGGIPMIASLGMSVGMLIIYIVFAAVTLVIAGVMVAAISAARAIPVWMIAKKVGRPKPWLALLGIIPVVGSFILQYAIMDLPGEKPFDLGGKIHFPKRSTPWLIWVATTVVGITAAFILFFIFSLIPVVGPFIGMILWAVVMIAAIAVSATVGFVSIRDVLELFYENEQNCLLISLAVTLGDIMLTNGLAEIVLLWFLAFQTPLEIPAEETLLQD